MLNDYGSGALGYQMSKTFGDKAGASPDSAQSIHIPDIVKIGQVP